MKETETMENGKRNESYQSKKLWVNILSENRNSANVMVIEFIAPKMVNGDIKIKIKEADQNLR